MQTFKHLFRDKTSNLDFKTLYEAECHVCGHTMRIFEKVEALGMDLEQLAADAEMEVNALQELRDADWCNPHQVIALCRHLDLKPPLACPRLQGSPEASPNMEGS
jgi:hypothetical protein